ncbi:DUF1493 family protein [Pantoea agglomerans]|uniref:DUF1493 family protein n=1 Tax=Enterobacter agglomerans TaxID=549 RepID=UPI003C7D1254
MTTTPDLVRKYILRELPLVTTLLLKKIEIGDDDILQELFEADDIAEVSEKFFRDFNVQPAGFTLATYFPTRQPESPRTAATSHRAASRPPRSVRNIHPSSASKPAH